MCDLGTMKDGQLVAETVLGVPGRISCLTSRNFEKIRGQRSENGSKELEGQRGKYGRSSSN